MPIQNRDLEAGTRLVGSYRKERYVCTVEEGEDGKLVYVLEDSRRFRSPSSAASAIMNGKAVNGWLFWSLEGEAQKAEPSEETPKKANGKGKILSRTPNQKGLAEGQTRWFCNACMGSFVGEGAEAPEACPKGHRESDLVEA